MTREEELKKIEETFAEIRRTGDRSRREEAGRLLKRKHELMMEDPEYRKEQEERARFWDEVYRREERIQEIKNEISQIVARGGTKEEGMDSDTDKKLTVSLIYRYLDLQRIKNAEDRDKELDLQIMSVKVQLEICGVNIENLKIEGLE